MTRTWAGPSARERKAVLDRTRTVAVVGASDNPARASFFVATYLLSTTPYEVWFVNPRVEQILGRPVYPSLSALPGRPDLVDVFRRPADLPGVLDETLAVGTDTFWLQLGLWDDDVARKAEDAGLTVVMDTCMGAAHRQLGLGPLTPSA